MKKCYMYCQNNLASLVGKRFVTCQIDGTYDGDFSTTKCVQSKSKTTLSFFQLSTSFTKDLLAKLVKIVKIPAAKQSFPWEDSGFSVASAGDGWQVEDKTDGMKI